MLALRTTNPTFCREFAYLETDLLITKLLPSLTAFFPIMRSSPYCDQSDPFLLRCAELFILILIPLLQASAPTLMSTSSCTFYLCLLQFYHLCSRPEVHKFRFLTRGLCVSAISSHLFIYLLLVAELWPTWPLFPQHKVSSAICHSAIFGIWYNKSNI